MAAKVGQVAKVEKAWTAGSWVGGAGEAGWAGTRAGQATASVDGGVSGGGRGWNYSASTAVGIGSRGRSAGSA